MRILNYLNQRFTRNNKIFYRIIYSLTYSLYVSLKYFDYSHNANKIDNLLYAIMTCQVQLILPSDWNFFLKKNEIIVYVNTGRYKD